MQTAQEIYDSTVSGLPEVEQLRLATLILEGVTQKSASTDEPPMRRSVREILREAPGGRWFKTAAEVDEYIREERDSWDR